MTESMDKKVTENKEQGHAEQGTKEKGSGSTGQDDRATNAAIAQVAAHFARGGGSSDGSSDESQ